MLVRIAIKTLCYGLGAFLLTLAVSTFVVSGVLHQFNGLGYLTILGASTLAGFIGILVGSRRPRHWKVVASDGAAAEAASLAPTARSWASGGGQTAGRANPS